MLPFIALIAMVMLAMASLSVDLGFASVQQLRLEALAEASATTSARIDATYRYSELPFNRPEDREWEGAWTIERDVECDTLSLDACIEETIDAKSETIEAEIAPSPETIGPDDGDIALGPGRLELRRDIQRDIDDDCNADPRCWHLRAEQAVPLTFGQASMVGYGESSLTEIVDARSEGSNFVGDGTARSGSLRAYGIPISADVRVEGRPVVRVGRPLPNGIPGRAPFAIEVDAWRDDFDHDDPVSVDIEDGQLLLDPDDGSPAVRVGRQIGGRQGLRAGFSILDGADGSFERLDEVTERYYAYVPLLAEGTSDVVVGFGLARVIVTGDGDLVLTRIDGSMAPWNASASARHLARDADFGLPDLARLRTARQAPANSGLFLEAPALQRPEAPTSP